MSLESVMKKTLKDLSDGSEKEVQCLNTGFPPLNKIISGRYDGGFPVGRIIEMFGPESSGKTAIATQLMIESQRAGGIAVFMDHEQSFHMGLAKGFGLDTDSGSFALVAPESYESSTSQAMNLSQEIRDSKAIDPEAPIVVVFDSLAAMVPAEKLEKGVDELTMRDQLALARVTSATLPAMMVSAKKYNAMYLFLNQMREKPGVVYGDNKTTPGGNAMKFAASVRMGLTRSQVKKDGEVIGQKIKCHTIKNKIYRPFQTTEWFFGFREDGSGYFDVTGSLIDYLVETGKIEKAGSRIAWEGSKIFKSQLVEQIEANGEIDKLTALL